MYNTGEGTQARNLKRWYSIHGKLPTLVAIFVWRSRDMTSGSHRISPGLPLSKAMLPCLRTYLILGDSIRRCPNIVGAMPMHSRAARGRSAGLITTCTIAGTFIISEYCTPGKQYNGCI